MMDLSGKKVLITGGAGFIGSHLVDFLYKKDCHIVIIDDLSNGNIRNIENPLKNSRVKFIKGSIEDAKLMDRLINKDQRDYIFHLASGNLLRSVENPIKDFQVTVLGILNILSAIRKSKIGPTLVFSSTGSVYGEPKFNPQKEDHTLEPVSAYGISKLAAEKYVLLWHKMFGIPAIILRYYNVYGPRQNFGPKGGVIGIFINQILNHKPIIIEGSGQQKRCFTYVDDVVRANILAATSKKAIGEVFNIASNQVISIDQLVSQLHKLFQSKVKIIYKPRRIGDVDSFNPDIAKAKLILGYKPEVTLEEGLKRTIAWFLNE